jgi:hypothetical protein
MNKPASSQSPSQARPKHKYAEGMNWGSIASQALMQSFSSTASSDHFRQEAIVYIVLH